MENGIWDEGQLGAVAGVLGIVDLFYNGRGEDITKICLQHFMTTKQYTTEYISGLEYQGM